MLTATITERNVENVKKLIEEAQLEGAALGQRTDLRTFQCCDPGQSI